jgi:aldose 1-epimerase
VIFGQLPDGHAVHRLTLSAGDLTVHLLTLGSILQQVWLTGVPHDLTLGSDRLDDYLNGMAWFGSIVGPVANRIGGARATVGGRPCQFESNFLGRHTLHSGAASVCHKVWTIAEQGPDHATLTVDLPDGDGGFPGNRRVTARWTVTAPATLRLDITTTTDADTLVNLTNHSYWNLDGTPDWRGHTLRIAADRVTAVDGDLIPTGALPDVADLSLDFRAARPPVPGQPPIDHNFCLADARRAMTDVLWLTGTGGLTMTVATTEPGLQVYDGLRGIRPGGGPYEGLAIEAQGWPDAVHHAHFPSTLLPAGETVTQATEWRFT